LAPCPAALWSLDDGEVVELGLAFWSALAAPAAPAAPAPAAPAAPAPVVLLGLVVLWSVELGEVVLLGLVVLWSVELGEVVLLGLVVLWSVELGEVVLLGLVVLWSGGGVVVLLPVLLVLEGFVVEVGALLGCDGLSVLPVVEFGTVWPMLLPVEVVVLPVLPVAPLLVELVSAVPEDGGFCEAVEP